MKYFLCLLMIISAKLSTAQNLVPNPSFEMLLNDSCVYGYPADWTLFSFSPDYFNACIGYEAVSVPANSFGYQYAADGEAYVGLYTRSYPGFPNYREFIGTQLPILTIGTKYYVSLKVASASCMNCFTNKLGAFFSTAPIQYNSNDELQQLPNDAQIFELDIITDTTNWSIIAGSFIADSAYQYIFLGCFFNESNTDSLFFQAPFCFYEVVSGDSNYCSAYYYIDDVCVSTDSLECDLNTSTNHQPVQPNFSIYPTPSHQVVNITLPQGSTQIEIFNAIGQSVYNSKVTSLHQVVDVSNFSDGIYFIRVQSHQVVQTEKFVVQH